MPKVRTKTIVRYVFAGELLLGVEVSWCRSDKRTIQGTDRGECDIIDDNVEVVRRLAP